MKRRLFGELVGLIVRRNERPGDILFTEPVHGDVNPSQFYHFDIGQSSELLRHSSARGTCKSKNSVARERFAGFQKFRQSFNNAWSSVASGADDEESRSHSFDRFNADGIGAG